MKPRHSWLVFFVVASLAVASARPAAAEVILQFFNNSWNEIAEKIPELAEVGYTSLWLPPPQKASGGLSVGYDLWDPFDFGSKDQRSSVKTRYGTEEELLRLIETAHRFGMRVYFDNIMNHRAFDVPGWDANTAIDIYPGMLPEDFHLRVTEEGFYRKWDNTQNWGSAWEVQNRNLSDLIDIAHETPNANFGPTEGTTHPKISFVRQPDNTDYYLDKDLPLEAVNGVVTSIVYTFADKEPYTDTGWTTNGGVTYTGADNGVFDWNDANDDGQHDAGEASEPFEDTGLEPTRPGWNTAAYGYGDGIYNMGDPEVEDVGGYLIRSARWIMDRTKVDGLRLDAVKHVPWYFFGAWDDNDSDQGYCGGAQVQFNLSRGFNDWDNHRDTVFDTEKSYGRNDAMMFGEHMGEPPSYDEYFAAGMRLVDAKIHQTLNDNLGNQWGSLQGLDSTHYVPGKQFGAANGVPYAKSHDDNVAYREELHYALNLTRAGLPDIYTDGNRQAETLGQSGGAFPRHANTAYLGQWGDTRIPNLVYIHDHFARADQVGKWGDSDVVVYERRDKRENTSMVDADGTVMIFMMNDDYSSGHQVTSYTTTFGVGAYLWQYADGGGKFYYTVPGDQKMYVTVPPGGYFAFSFRSPEESDLWAYGGGNPVTIYEGNGSEAGWVSYVRRDGPDGDPGFNPYGITDTNTTDFAYTYYVPRVTSSTNLRFAARVDGSAFNVYMKLDGGMDLNGLNHSSGDARDYPPANEGSTDVFLGYETNLFKMRIGPEKFAGQDSARCKIASAGAETYALTVGTAGFTVNQSTDTNDWSDTYTASWIYHDPDSTNDISGDQFWPYPEDAADDPIYVWVKVGHSNDINRLNLYYTTDGATWPEGAGGEGVGTTHVVPLTNDHYQGGDEWWTGLIPAQTNGTVIRYKVGGARQQGYLGAAWDCPFPTDAGNVARKVKMMGVWEAAGVNPATITYRPHNDFGPTVTGLVDGFHVLRARAFLQRDGAAEGNGKRAAIYNTFVQPFYLDTETPQGEIKYPTAGETYWQNQYGLVVRTDPTVQKVWYNIDDDEPANDDAQTGEAYGNGTNVSGGTTWIEAYKVTPSLSIPSDYPEEWRFTYANIPTNGQAVVRVRLHELSTSTNMGYSAVDGHYTELARTNDTRAPAVTFAFGWPTNDGAIVEAGWDVWARFSSSLGDGYTDAEMLERFLIRINDVAQSRDDYVMTRDAGGGLGTLYYNLPDLYNGDTDFSHLITVTYETSGGVTLQANRYVKARPVDTGPQVQIIDPPEVDGDGQPFKIVLPDVAAPAATQRQYTIRVETDTDALNCWIAFTNCTGYTMPYANVTNELTGTVAVVQGSTLVTGTNTKFNSELTVGSTVVISTNYLTVTQITSETNLGISPAYPGPSASGLTAYKVTQNPSRSGNKQYWSFLWTNMAQGYFTFAANVDTNSATNTIEASASRGVTVVFRDVVNSDTNDLDDDDDGMFDAWETTPTNLPVSNPETWTNEEVHIWYAFGRSESLLPDTDGDGLPDGIELGWRHIDTNETDTAADSNGDGWKNFMADQDPPVYNTKPDNQNFPNYNFYDSRTKLIHGSVTDPNNADSDYDGILDGTEDANRNGWVDGDGTNLPFGWDPWPAQNFANGIMDAGEKWLETNPNDWDTDGDGAADGWGEDTNANGRVAGDLNSNRVWEAGELWTETDPLNADTDGDSLPDGWEKTYGLDPFDDGVLGHTNLMTGAVIATNVNGASGNPDADKIIEGPATNDYTNFKEYQNGTNPRVFDSEEPPAEGDIVVGRGASIGELAGSGTQYQEFTDWTWDDLLVLDEYEGDGPNNQQGDTYLRWDGWDSSRDIVAFYAHDGGDVGSGGDGNFYFRVDIHDLQAYAEEGFLNIYVVIDSGNPAQGEMGLPDDVDAMTSNRWEAIVAVYQSSQGRVYVDLNPASNSTTIADGYNLTPFGVEVRDQTHAYGFQGAYFNSELDSVEFSISRQALRDAGWNGLSATSLNYQVFSTKDDTCNSPEWSGDTCLNCCGDIGGRNDICDSIYDDDIAEDYWEAQSGIKNALGYWFSGGNRVGRAKLAVVVHGNQAIQPGSYAQDLINNGAGAGYYRPLAAHELFGQPLNLHVTPTLASAIEWARVDTNLSPACRDGPAFNDWVGELMATGVVSMLGSTFSDHILPYFPSEYNQDNAALAEEFLGAAYGFAATTSTVFWTPERVLDADTCTKILAMGYHYTLVDQLTHMWHWLSRTTALGDDGYRLNRINGVNCFVMNDGATAYRFDNDDGGLPLALRKLLSRKSRSGTQDQVVTLFSNWEDFGDADDSDAYDLNVRWLANHPWVHIVALEDIADGQIDVTGDEAGDAWYVIDRGAIATNKIAHDWLHHATELNYDNWYVGSAYEESLENRYFQIRPGTNMPARYGMLYSAGIVTESWDAVTSIADGHLAKLARAALHASVFETAFHNQTNESGTARFSTGEYIYNDTDYEELAEFAEVAQAQGRMAAVYETVDTWLGNANAGWYDGIMVATNADADMDGEDEYLLYNDRLFAYFDRVGGRMIGAWTRDIINNEARQAVGNFASFAGRETEFEGTNNVDPGGVLRSYRTSGLKEWWATAFSNKYVNDIYSFSNRTNGWRATSSDTFVQKTVTLAANSPTVSVQYALSGGMSGQPLYVRHGLSLDLYDLLKNGQATLGQEVHQGGVMTMVNTGYESTVSAAIDYSQAGAQTTAIDDDPGQGVTNYTINMRNQAQTHQVELVGTNSFSFTMAFTAQASDWDGDRMPNTYEDDYDFDPADGSDGLDDDDGDRINNGDEYVAGTHPTNGNDFLRFSEAQGPTTGVVVRFPAKQNRRYWIWYANEDIVTPAWSNATPTPITVPADTNPYEWTDDGSNTSPDPDDPALDNRFYKIEVGLPL